MNFKKAFSVAAAAAMAVSVAGISTFAVKSDKIEAVKLDGNASATEGNVIQWPISTFTSISKVGKITVKGTASVADWCGGGGAIGFDTTAGWKQVDFALDGANVTLDSATGEFTAECDFGGVTPDISKADGIIQLGWWWGSGDGTMQVTDVLVDGTSVMGLEAVAAPAEEPAAEEEAAATEAPAEETAEETTLPAETEAVEEELLEEEAAEEEAAEDEEAEEEAAEEEAAEDEAEEPADPDFGGFADYDEVTGTQVGGEGSTDGAWGQAVVMYTYNNIAEDEEPGENPFDESLINPDNYIVVYYESDVAPELILQSWSGGQGWAKVPCDETLSQPGMAVFTYDYMTAMYPDDLSTLDAVNVGDQGAPLTVTGVYVMPVAVPADGAGNTDDYSVEADANENAAPATPAATDASVSSPATGNTALGGILAVMAVAGAAAIAAKKRK